MSRSVELSASVYSVVSCKPSQVDEVKAYLYAATVVHDLPGFSIAEAYGADRPTPVVLKTTAVKVITDEDAARARSTGSHLFDRLAAEARQLAQVQCERLASGLFAARPVGAAIDAYEYIAALT